MELNFFQEKEKMKHKNMSKITLPGVANVTARKVTMSRVMKIVLILSDYLCLYGKTEL